MKPTTLVSTRLVVAYEARSDLAGEVNRSYFPHNALRDAVKYKGTGPVCREEAKRNSVVPVETQPLAVDHSARASMKSAASRIESCELQLPHRTSTS